MKVDSLSFHHFRNLCDGELQASDGVNVIWGDNAQGKTNLLEAIWLFTGSRSFLRRQGCGAFVLFEKGRGLNPFLYRSKSGANSKDYYIAK